MCSGEPEWLFMAEPAKRVRKRAAAAAAGANDFTRSGDFGRGNATRRPAAVAPASAGGQKKSVAGGIDSELREYLCVWRRMTARQLGIASSSVMHDTSLDELCRIRPRSVGELRGISGFGERKTRLYGSKVLDALDRFRRGERAAAPQEAKPKPAEETMKLLAEGRSFAEIAKARGRQVSSVVELVVRLMEKGEVEFQEGWVDREKQAQIEKACALLGVERLKPLKEALPPEITFEEIRLVIARLRMEREEESSRNLAAKAGSV